MWLAAVPEAQTAKEAEKLERLLNAREGGELLDVPCGGGRLSQALVARGYQMTGVDWSNEFLSHARSKDTQGLVAWEQRDMRDLPWSGRFDGAFCVGNSFGYLDDEGNAAFLRAVCGALKPGARFVVETPMVLENLLGQDFRDRFWWKVGDIHLLIQNNYDHTSSRLEVEYTFVADGAIETRRGTHRAYSYRELAALFEATGFHVELAEPWAREARTLYFVATRR